MISYLWIYLNSTIFPRCCLQCQSFFRGVGDNADQFSTMWTTTWKNYWHCGSMQENTHELKLEHITALLPTTQKKGKMVAVVDNNVEHFSALWATTSKNVQRCGQQHGRTATTEQYTFLWAFLYLLYLLKLKSQFPLIPNGM
jgi:hypothetical protein